MRAEPTPEAIEWHEPPRSPENVGVYVSYRQFLLLAYPMFRRLLAIELALSVALAFVLVLAGHGKVASISALWAAFSVGVDASLSSRCTCSSCRPARCVAGSGSARRASGGR